MTDHLDEAATKAVELAALLTTPTDLDDTLRVGAAAHLTYLAGLIRGGAVRAAPPIESVHLGRVTFGGRTELDELRAQRDELLAAIRDASADNGRPPVLRLQDVVDVAKSIEADR
jgi:hypothetical protein